MTKRNLILISILLIASAVLIEFLNEANTTLDYELIDFFAGILFGTGFILFFQQIKRKRIQA